MRLFFGLALCLVLLVQTGYAAGGNNPWSDSLMSRALSGGPSLQDILNSLGYSINVATDEISLMVFAPPAGGTSAEVTLRYQESASSASLGWYYKGTPGVLTQLFPAGTPAGSKAPLSVLTDDSLGFYLGPTLYSDTWYTQKSRNWDNFKHIKAFPAGAAGKYVIAWEDLPDGGDQDYNDMIVEVRFQDPNQLFLTIDGATDILVCDPDSICFQITGSGGVGSLTLARLIDGSPAVLATGPSPLSYRFCFLPTSYAITDYRFIFRLTDQASNVLYDTLDVHLRFQNLPTLIVDPDFIDTVVCDLDSICFDVVSAIDPDGDNVRFILVEGPGEIDSATGEICFLPAEVDSADYSFVVMVSDSCCYDPLVPKSELPCPRDTILVRVHLSLPPTIVTINDTLIDLCKVQEVCFPVSARLPNGEPTPVYQDCGPGTLSNNQLCFTPTGEGTYLFCFYANDACGGSVHDSVRVTITLNHPPVANAGRDSTLSQCAPAEICWPAGCSDPDGDLSSCTLIQGPGTFDGSRICFTPTGSGSYRFILKATDSCTEIDVDTAIINVTTENPPVARVSDTSVTQCVPTQVCLPASCSDPDGDLASCELVSGSGVYDGSKICFTPVAAGEYRFVLKATDSCGMVDYDTGVAVVILNRPPQVTPGVANFVLCSPETICVPIVATDPDGNNLTFTTTMGRIVNSSVCLWSGGEGRRQLAYNVIATDPCGAKDTGLYVVNVLVNMVPIIQVPSPTPQNLCDPTQLCFDVDAIDSIMAKLTFSLLTGPGSINPSTGVVCFTPQSAGLYGWQIVVRDSCGKADTGSVNWQINLVAPPTPVSLPPAEDTVVCVGTVIDSLCVPFTYQEQANVVFSFSAVPNISFSTTYQSGSGKLCFRPLQDVDTVYAFTFRRINECHDTVSSIYDYRVAYDPCDSNCLVVSIEQTNCVTLGSQVSVDISVDQVRIPIGGYDLLIKYDVSAFSVLQANIGGAIPAWEYFTYRLGPFGNCGNCPSGLIRLVAIADMNNGSAHPPASQFRPDGVIATITFIVTSNALFEGLVYPVEFFWIDCGDNGVSSVSGDTLLIDKIIYNPENVLWDEFDELNYPESARLPYVGAPDECLIGNKKVPLRCVEFHNGFICIIDSDSIDVRGDINLNGIANEIADAVLYTNYFLRGISALPVLGREGSIAASDVNNDGRTLTIGDLIYLLRILSGDAQPIPKLAPYAESANFTLQRSDGYTTIWSDCSTEIGGVYMQVKIDGDTPPQINNGSGLGDIKMESAVDNNRVTVLIYAKEKGTSIAAGKSELLTISGECEIIHVEAADYYGSMLDSRVAKTGVPAGFALGQNYPNPFNPATTITISLPTTTEWNLSIINVNGQVVRRYSGMSPAGLVTVKWDATDQNGQPAATGVYFYRLDAGSFTETRKMLLLK